MLLDTCVLSEIRHPKGSAAVKSAVRSFPSENLYISVLSVGEIAKGVSMLEEGPRRHELGAWLQLLERDHADRILPIDLDTAQIWGEMVAAAQRAGISLPAVDGLIAATAHRHGLHVMTRNVDDFRATGVMLFNPWSASPR